MVVKKKNTHGGARKGAGRKEAKYVSNSKMKCYMRRAKNGSFYRTCETPPPPKKPRRQLRGNPKLPGDRKLPYKTKNNRPPTTRKTKKK